MYHKVRITVVSLVVMAITVLSSVGTLSYFTDSEGTTNDFTIGNASTTLAIYDDVAGDTKHAFDVSTYSPLTDKQEIPFYLQATNDGNIPVYQRFRVVIPYALASVVKLDLPNMNECVVETVAGNTCSNDNYTVIYDASVEVNDVPTYAEYYIVSNRILDVEGGASVTSEWPTAKISIDGLNDVNKDLFTCTGGNTNNCMFGIGVYSDVIQSAGFTDGAVKAFEGFPETYN